jgi:5-oxoprolinase (ATP-hydrolysing)
MVADLKKQALSALDKEGYPPTEMLIKSVFSYLRLQGQSHAIEVPFSENLSNIFKNKYQGLFGYWPKGKKIEVESLKVIACTRAAVLQEAERQGRKRPMFPSSFGSWNPNYDWDTYRAGDYLDGDAVLSNAFGTVFIPMGWELILQGEGDAILRRLRSRHTRESKVEEVELELFTNRFSGIAEKAGLQLQRTAFSVNIKERLDFSCALLDPDAHLLVNAPHIPVHLGSLGICARLILAEFPLENGDIIITNHPRYGGSHLPDVTLLCAVYDNENQLIGYLINRAHHAEIGGSRPGSMPPTAKCLSEEGVVIPPTYLARRGQVNWEAIQALLTQADYPTRALAENLADINAAVASLKSGEVELRELARKHGTEKVRGYMRKLAEASSDALQTALLPWRGKTLRAEEYLDDGHRIQVKIQVQTEKLIIDFEGSSPVHSGNLNANPAIVNSVIIYVLRLLCDDPRIPLNEGLMREVDIRLPKTSFLSPDFNKNPIECPAVVGGNTEVSQRLTDTLLKAFGLVACSQGTMNNFLFGNERFGYYETIGGGTGAGAGFHGRHAVHQHMTNTRITDPEELEFRYPVRLWTFAVRRGSGGAGRYRGGDGIVREMEFLEGMNITIISQHRKEAPYGMYGGESGKVGGQFVIREDNQKEALRHIDQVRVDAGDRLRIETPGGGGWGHSSE